jgi:enoyl-[acyl-carrier-protein] reductase (NADH)
VSVAQQIRSRLDQLEFNREYDTSVFGDITSKETIKKTLQRSRDKIGKTTTKYFYLKYTPQNRHKAPYEVYDDQKEVLFDPSEFSFNAFWQSGKPTMQKVSSVIQII